MAVIIDFHSHIFPPRIRDNRAEYISADPCFAALYSTEKARLATADELIESMDREGIDISVVLNIGWSTHELCIETNDYIIESVNRYPDRLTGFCGVQPGDIEGAVQEIERCARSGIKGIGELRPDIQRTDLSDTSITDSFVQAMVENDMVLLVHSSEPAGHAYQGKGRVTPDILYPFIVRYPELKVVCAHWGGGLPFYHLMPEVRRAFGNVYYDTAASPFLYSPEIYRHVAGLAGPDRILFGTDYPLLRQGRLLKEIEELGLPENEKKMILSGNAAGLLGLG